MLRDTRECCVRRFSNPVTANAQLLLHAPTHLVEQHSLPLQVVATPSCHLGPSFKVHDV
jgi:hypothetical protein